ncbi:phospholipase-like protein [Tanacetum coccineum]
MVDVQVHQEIPTIQQTLLLDVIVSVIPKQTTPTTTPPTTEAPATPVAKTNPSPTVLQRLSTLEKKVAKLSKVDHSEVIEESIQAIVLNEVKNQIPKFLPKAVSEFVEPRSERTVRDVLKKNPINLGVENMKNALIIIIKSIRQEMKDGIMKRQVETSTTNDEVSSIASNEEETPPCQLPKDLSLGSFLLPFKINNHNLYATATLDAKDNFMPLRVYGYLGLDKLRDTSTLENTTGTNEHLGTVNIIVKFRELEFSCNFVIKMAEDVIILGRPFLESTRAQIDVFNEEISFEIGTKKFKFNIDSCQSMEKIYMVDITQEEETFNPIKIGIDLFSYESLACLEFEQITRSYGTPIPQDEIKPISFSPDRRGLVKRWYVCKPIHVTYDDRSGEDCGMLSTCDPDSKFCFGYNNLHQSDHEFIFNEWILDSYDVEEEYARIGKKGYVLDDVWEKCQQNYKKSNEAWHGEAHEEDKM